MSNVFTSAGTTVSISSILPSPYSAGGFGNISNFVEIGEVTDLGEYGREYAAVNHNPLKERRTIKRKGSYNDGALSLQLARVPTDAGQIALRSALNSDSSYSFKVVLQNGTVQFFTGQVMSYTTNVGGVDQITSASVTVEIDNDIIEA